MRKIKILDEGKLKEDIHKHLISNHRDFFRDQVINEILSEKTNIEDSISTVNFNLYGSTFQGKGTRNVFDLKYASHVVQHIIIENGVFYGMVKILDTPMGRPLNNFKEEEYNRLPIYNSEGKISSFDIDTNHSISFIQGTESFHYTIK